MCNFTTQKPHLSGKGHTNGSRQSPFSPASHRIDFTMKLQPDRLDVQSILGYGPGWVGLGHKGVTEKIERSIVIGSRGEKFDWHCTRFEQLTEEHFTLLAETRPELVIFGSGVRLRFAPPAFFRALMAQRIGVETMDTLAACRTYNFLAGEGRQVIAALLIEPPADKGSKE